MMKTLIKLIICAIFSFSIGIACASPLLVTELYITPFIEHVQGPTANYIINVVYANFTIINASNPISEYSGPDIAYYVVLEITNPSNISAQLLDVEFTAANNNTNTSSSLFMSGASGQGYTLEGAWLDGKWYNVTWANGSLPVIDGNGKIVASQDYSGVPGHWIQGVELDDVYVNGTLIYTYMNMNGTWTDVTSQINVIHPSPVNPFAKAGSVGSSTIVQEHYVFEPKLPNSGMPNKGDTSAPFVTKYVWTGNGLFNNSWAPNQTRLILLSGMYEIRRPFANDSALTALKSGNITLQTQTMDVAEGMGYVNNTMTDTSAYPMEQKQILLTQNGDSYIYNAILGDKQVFQEDQWGVEVFVK
jgi:hypothetical protein